MRRTMVVGALAAVVMVMAACAPSDETQPKEPALSTTTTTAHASSTATEPPPPSTAAPTSAVSDTTTTIAVSHELGVWAAPADGQWFAELPIPWVFSSTPPPDSEAGGVPGALGWTRGEARVTVNGVPTEQEWCTNCMYQQGALLVWRAPDDVGDPRAFEPVENTVVITASFDDGQVVEVTRRFFYDPSLTVLTGSVVELDPAAPSATFAAATREPLDEGGFEYGPVSSVTTYPVLRDAAFVLLGPESSGEPPLSVISFDDFVELMDKSATGECNAYTGNNPCFFAAGRPVTDYDFTIYLTNDGQLQQLKQDWSP